MCKLLTIRSYILERNFVSVLFRLSAWSKRHNLSKFLQYLWISLWFSLSATYTEKRHQALSLGKMKIIWRTIQQLVEIYAIYLLLGRVQNLPAYIRGKGKFEPQKESWPPHFVLRKKWQPRHFHFHFHFHFIYALSLFSTKSLSPAPSPPFHNTDK